MKILYGVQATGNGHISRARAMNQQFKKQGAVVDYIFSGRSQEDYFDMDEFDHKRYFRGLTLCNSRGKVNIRQTIQHNNLPQLYQDIRALDTRRYDLVISDFEPVSAWASRRQHTFSIGIGHQYSFHQPVPTRGDNSLSRFLIHYFAPAQLHLGMHWHHFNCPILPPIIDMEKPKTIIHSQQYMVYLAFEEQADIIQLLKNFTDYIFICYGNYRQARTVGNITFKPASRQEFKQDLASSAGVICNAGFELPSEALHWGIKLLVKPLQGQFEQISNARAIEELGLGLTMDRLDSRKVGYWLRHFCARHIDFPNVAEAVVKWILAGDWQNIENLAEPLWQQVNYIRAPGLAPQYRYLRCEGV